MSDHLIHIGYPKAGSTFLQRWFEVHPQIAYAEGGIAGYDNVYDMVRQAAAPASGMRCRVTSSESLSIPRAHFGQTYFDSWKSDAERVADAEAEACDALAALFPHGRVLVVTRGFRSMILSSFSQYVRTGGALGLEELTALARNAGPWDYDRLIGRYRGAFGADRVLALPYELLRADSEAFLAKIETWLGLDHFPGPKEAVNAALTPAELAWYPRFARVAARIRPRRLGRLYGRLAFEGRLRPAANLLQRLRPLAAPAPQRLPDEVVDAFRGKAECLRDDPLYAPYADDYLF